MFLIELAREYLQENCEHRNFKFKFENLIERTDEELKIGSLTAHPFIWAMLSFIYNYNTNKLISSKDANLILTQGNKLEWNVNLYLNNPDGSVTNMLNALHIFTMIIQICEDGINVPIIADESIWKTQIPWGSLKGFTPLIILVKNIDNPPSNKNTINNFFSLCSNIAPQHWAHTDSVNNCAFREILNVIHESSRKDEIIEYIDPIVQQLPANIWDINLGSNNNANALREVIILYYDNPQLPKILKWLQQAEKQASISSWMITLQEENNINLFFYLLNIFNNYKQIPELGIIVRSLIQKLPSNAWDTENVITNYKFGSSPLYMIINAFAQAPTPLNQELLLLSIQKTEKKHWLQIANLITNTPFHELFCAIKMQKDPAIYFSILLNSVSKINSKSWSLAPCFDGVHKSSTPLYYLIQWFIEQPQNPVLISLLENAIENTSMQDWIESIINDKIKIQTVMLLFLQGMTHKSTLLLPWLQRIIQKHPKLTQYIINQQPKFPEKLLEILLNEKTLTNSPLVKIIISEYKKKSLNTHQINAILKILAKEISSPLSYKGEFLFDLLENNLQVDGSTNNPWDSLFVSPEEPLPYLLNIIQENPEHKRIKQLTLKVLSRLQHADLNPLQSPLQNICRLTPKQDQLNIFCNKLCQNFKTATTKTMGLTKPSVTTKANFFKPSDTDKIIMKYLSELFAQPINAKIFESIKKLKAVNWSKSLTQNKHNNTWTYWMLIVDAFYSYHCRQNIRPELNEDFLDLILFIIDTHDLKNAWHKPLMFNQEALDSPLRLILLTFISYPKHPKFNALINKLKENLSLEVWNTHCNQQESPLEILNLYNQEIDTNLELIP